MKRLLPRFPFPFILLGLALSSTGCASIFSGSSQEVQITSAPSAANVKIERTVKDGSAATVWTGTTPAVVNLKRKHPYLVTISREGYQTAERGIQKSTNGWVFGNLIFFPLGTLIGAGIDYGTGAAHRLNPNKLFVALPPASASVPADRTRVVPDQGAVEQRAPHTAPQGVQAASPAPQPALSTPQPVPQYSRQGFLIGFGLGPGLTSFSHARDTPGGKFVSDRESRTTLMTDFKIGYAPDDLLQLYWASKVSWFSESDVLFLHGIGGLGASYALKPIAPSPYVNAGIGFSTWQAPLEQDFETRLGLGLSAGAGFEFSRNWVFNLDLTWGKPSRDNLSTDATALRFTINYLHY